MLSEREIWAVAQHVLSEKGDGAPLFVAGRIGALAVKGDEPGVATWIAVARRLVQLRAEPPPAQQLS